MKRINNVFIFCVCFLSCLYISAHFLLKLLEKIMKDNTNLEIFRRIFLLLSILIMATFLIIKIIKKTNKKICYKYYIQGNDYKIKEKNIGEKISLEDINKYMDYNTLRNNDIMCCGIDKNGNFVEVSFAENEYLLRIFRNGDEKTETISDCSKINEIIYRNINKNER